VILIARLPDGLTMTDAFAIAGEFHKLSAVDFSLDVKQRYTFWSGLLGGMFLALSYFGTDQSQVQRYIGGASLRECRLGLMFNAVCKIPMQFFILLLGVMVFVFYQFAAPPLLFNQTAWKSALARDSSGTLHSLQEQFAAIHARKRQFIEQWLSARRAGDIKAEGAARGGALAMSDQSEAIRTGARKAMLAVNPKATASDADYVFITFILDYLPHGLIGLLVAAFFAAAFSSKAAELNALGSTTVVDVYRHVIKLNASDAHYVAASKWFTVFWGCVALAFALFANLVENLIQAANIVGSIFYGVPLAMFLAAFFLRAIGGTAIFWAAVAAQVLVIVLYPLLNISYLWYNLIGCGVCLVLCMILQLALNSTEAAKAA
jgi:uncharacterized sodium:solute symporter family permease YidK